MRLFTLNLRHGGGRRMPALAGRLVETGADVLVLTEYRYNPAGEHLHRALHDAGYVHRRASCDVPRRNGLLVAARQPLRLAPHRSLAFDPLRLMRVRMDGLLLVAAHLPNLKAKIPHWAALLQLASAQDSRPAAFVGDFNTGLEHEDVEGGPFPFTGAEAMRALLARGWVDAWRRLHPERREFTWLSHRGRGFRLDHAFLSPTAAGHLCGARFDHAYREQGLTDHSGLFVELTP